MTQVHVGGQDQDHRHGQPDQPAGDQDGLPPDPVRERAGHEVGDRLGRSERDEERERGGRRRDAEDVGREERHDRPLLPDHPADERADTDEQCELAGVRAQTQGHPRASRPCHVRRLPASSRDSFDLA